MKTRQMSQHTNVVSISVHRSKNTPGCVPHYSLVCSTNVTDPTTKTFLLDQMAWEAILDFPRTSWYKLNYLRAVTPLAYPNAQSRFQNTWVRHRNEVFCIYDGTALRWQFARPRIGSFS
jgi:hypothetical protein